MTTAHKIKLVNDRVVRAKALLLSQFKDSPNINAFLEALVDELQVLENTITTLQDVRTLNGSYGWWLDRIGDELKVSRGNYNDADYKTAIKIAMAKKTASASKEDIERIAFLLTGDNSVTLDNPYPYMLELVGYLFCIADSQEGLAALADLFPANTRVRLIKRDVTPFRFNTVGAGFGSGALLNSLVYHRYGNTNDERFTTLEEPMPPIPTEVAPFNVVSPTVFGDNNQGSTLTLDIGQWSGDDPITYTYQWLRNNSSIDGETGLTYIIVEGDLDQAISCRVTATNDAGTSTALSNSIIVNAEAPPAQVFTSNLGLDDNYGFNSFTFDGESKSAVSAITFNADGTVVRAASQGETVINTNDQYLATVATDAGNNFTVSYIIVSGATPAGIQPNVTYTINTLRTLGLTASGNQPTVITGTYTFTIRNIADPSIVQTKTITLGAELIDAIN